MIQQGTTGVIYLEDERWLVNVGGMPLLHRLLLSGGKAGVHTWRILAKHEPAQIRARLAETSKLQGIDWQIDDLQQVDQARLDVSAYQAVIAVFFPAVLDDRLISALQNRDGSVLGVTSSTVESLPAMTVRNEQVMDMPATTAPESYATGVLRCPSTVFTTILQAAWQKAPGTALSFSHLLSALVASTPVQALDVSPYVWVPLVTSSQDTLAGAETQLLRSVARQGESPLVRWISRPLSRRLTRRLMHTAITPNQITFSSALLGFSSAGLLAQPAYAWQILGAFLFLLSTIIDGCDGEIARLTFQESAFGAKLDAMMDNAVHCLLFPSIALGLYRQHPHPLYLVLGGLSVLGVVVSMLVYLPHHLHLRQMPRSVSRLHESLASRDFAYVLPVLALTHGLDWFLWATTVGTFGFAAAWAAIRWANDRVATHPRL